MAKLNKVFIDANEKYLSKVIVYAHTDTFLYADSKHTSGNTISSAMALDLCKKGLMLIENGGKFYEPVFFGESGGTTTVNVINQGGSVEIKAFKSKEPTVAA